MGVPHNGELPYVWGWTHLKLNPKIRMDAAIPIDVINWDEEDQEWTDYFLKMWTNFAKYGDPTPTPVPAPRGNPDTKWMKYNTETFEYMYLDRQNEEKRNYRQRNFAFWLNYFPSLANYTLFPAGEPLVLPKDAEGGWKTWSLPKKHEQSSQSYSNTNMPGFDSSKFSNNMNHMYSKQLNGAVKQGGHEELVDSLTNLFNNVKFL